LLRDRRVLITGGAGYVGRALAADLLEEGASLVRIVSRNRSNHESLIQYLRHDNLECIVGDVRDQESMKQAVDGIDIVIHAAATKTIEDCESHPFEAISTNVQGTANVLNSCIGQGVSRVICLSSTYALHSQSFYGATKLIAERLVRALSRTPAGKRTVLMCIRLPSILGGEGSVFQIFESAIRSGTHITITDARARRFMITRPEASRLVMRSLLQGKSGEVFVPKCRPFRIVDLARALMEIEQKTVEIRTVTSRDDRSEAMLARQRIHDAILNEWEARSVKDIGYAYVIPREPRPVTSRPSSAVRYKSQDVPIMTKTEMIDLIRRDKLVSGKGVAECQEE